MKNNTLILNRDFQHPDDGWYQIEAKGDHPNVASKIIQIIDDEACQSIVNRFNADAAAPNFPGMLIDHEHFKHDSDKESLAYGWLMKLQNRADGIYGQIRWTNTGKTAVDGGDYRFFSTEYDPGEVKILNTGKPAHVRPLRLDGLTLTNDNNNKGQRPITNRKFPSGNNAETEHQETKKMKTVSTLLGLSADASEEAVHAEVTKIINREKLAQGQLTIVTNRATTAETKVQTLEAGLVDADLETYKNRYKPEGKEFIRTSLITNRAATIQFLEAQPVIQGATAPVRIHNRENAKGVDKGVEAADDQEAVAQQRRDAIQDYKIKNRCSHSDATSAVRQKSPELFGLPARKQ